MESEIHDQTETIPEEPPFEALPPHGHDNASLQETARDWIERNQSTAMLAAFAVGVFLGVLMRR